MALSTRSEEYFFPEEPWHFSFCISNRPSGNTVDSTSFIPMHSGEYRQIKTDSRNRFLEDHQTDGSMEANTSALKDNGGFGVPMLESFTRSFALPRRVFYGTITFESSEATAYATRQHVPKYVVLTMSSATPRRIGHRQRPACRTFPTANREMFSKKIDNEISKLDCSESYVKGWRVELEFGWSPFLSAGQRRLRSEFEAKDKAYPYV